MVVGKKNVMVASDKIFTLNSAKFYRYWLTGGLAPREVLIKSSICFLFFRSVWW